MVHDYSIMFEKLFLKSGLSIDRLKTFCEIAEAGAITRAAGGKPGIQSQYSKQLKDLETYFEVPLFERNGKTMRITEAGKRLLSVAKEFLNSVEFLAEEF